MAEIQKTHLVVRTSPKGPGQKFIGTCALCGQTGLKAADALSPCPNPDGVTKDGVLLAAIDPETDNG